LHFCWHDERSCEHQNEYGSMVSDHRHQLQITKTLSFHSQFRQCHDCMMRWLASGLQLENHTRHSPDSREKMQSFSRKSKSLLVIKWPNLGFILLLAQSKAHPVPDSLLHEPPDPEARTVSLRRICTWSKGRQPVSLRGTCGLLWTWARAVGLWACPWLRLSGTRRCL
jgi:hypothetical protein